MSFVIQASPLTKIFLHRDWTDRCIDNPELIHKSTPGLFKVTIPRSMGAIVIDHLTPVAHQDLVPRQPNRKVEHDETRDVVPWLTGGEGGTRFSETDIYGVVQVDLGMNYTQLLSQLLMLEASADIPHIGENPDQTAARKAQAVDRTRKVQEAAKAKIQEALAAARERANERVMRAARTTFSFLHRQFQRNIEQGMGRYEPTGQEALCAFILRDQITKARQKKRSMMDEVSGVMKDVINL